MSNPAKTRGSAFERLVVGFLRAWFPHVERAYGAGRPDDRGDLAGIPWLAMECKAHKEINLASFMDEAVREAANAGADVIPVAIVKRRGKGIDRAYAVMELRHWAPLISELDRGRAT